MGLAVSLLFVAGARPGAAVIGDLAERCGGFSISAGHGTAEAVGEVKDADAAGEHVWLELLASGLAFDILGLAPGPPAGLPPCAQAYVLDDDTDPLAMEALTLRPGSHLAGGQAMFPIIRTLALLAASLARADGVVAVAWHPARSWCRPGYFRDGVLRWIEGGALFGCGLVALSVTADGGIQSEGLALFTGQELRIEPELMLEPAEGETIGIRLLDHLFECGKIETARPITGPGGLPLRLEPSANGRFVRVWSG